MRRIPLTAVAIATVLVLPSVAFAGTSYVRELSNSTANPPHAFKGFDAPESALADFDGDGRAEIVSHNDNSYLYVLSTASARVLAELRVQSPWSGVKMLNPPVVHDVDSDGKLDIVATNNAAWTCRWEFVSGSSTTSMTFDLKWCKRADTYEGAGASSDSDPWVEDVDGDGLAEIFVQTEKRGFHVFNHDGSIRWRLSTYNSGQVSASGGNAGPLVVDLENDGRKEVLWFTDSGHVHALYATDGRPKWEWPFYARVDPGSISVAGTAADADNDGKKEIAFIVRHAPSTQTDYDQNHFVLFVIKSDGKTWRKVQPSWGNPLGYVHPVWIDVDGDGYKDVVAQDWNTIGHKPGNWEALGPANVFAYSPVKDQMLWHVEVSNPWSNDDVIVADVDGDGAHEALVIDSSGFRWLNLRTGAKEGSVSLPNGWNTGGSRAPLVGDFDSDGKLDIAMPVYSSSRGGAFLFWKTDAPCKVHYSGAHNKDPCHPIGGRGGGSDPDPDPPTGDFDASFQDASGNEWWIQVDVTATGGTLAGVDARVNGGSWVALELKSWGDWAKSIRAPEGSLVQFRARATSGATELSGCYRWVAASPTSCDGGGGGGTEPTTFDATFSSVSGNGWWIETRVSAKGGTLAGVDARVNGGSWVPLELRSWGAWAKSIRAPEGSIVQFRARDTTGATDLSGCYRWTSATPVACSGGGDEPSGTFDASFADFSGNEWWIQVDVDANKPLAGVDARVNGGAWSPLELKSWGDWARSMHAPAGSTVEFRARATTGETDTSSGVRWPPP